VANAIVKTYIAAPVARCFDLARDVGVHCQTAAFTAERAIRRDAPLACWNSAMKSRSTPVISVCDGGLLPASSNSIGQCGSSTRWFADHSGRFATFMNFAIAAARPR
jgi:hypothetical protein